MPIYFNMETQVLQITQQSLKLAVELLNNSQLVGIPTETVYGLGANGLDSQAVKKIFTVKGRPIDNPLIAHVHKDYDINKLVYVKHDYVYKLMQKFMPGPLTLVFDSKGVVCKEAVCGGDTLAIRMPSHEGCQKLLALIDKPIVAPSANLSKHTSPVKAQHVYDDLNGKISLILDGGKCSGGIESTVLDVTESVPRILRAGLITKEMIEQVCGACQVAKHQEGDRVKSPGVKYRHYRPKCDAVLFNKNQIEKAIDFYSDCIKQGKKPYIMCEDSLASNFEGKNLLLLGNSGEQIASNLYDKLLEGEKVADVIIAIDMDREDGVYLGIINRLRKSCG